MDFRLFQPIASVRLAVTASSGNVALPGSFTSGQIRNVRLVNGGDNEVFIAFGDSTVTALADGTSMYLGPTKSAEIFFPDGATHVAAICSSGETSDFLFITTGVGI